MKIQSLFWQRKLPQLVFIFLSKNGYNKVDNIEVKAALRVSEIMVETTFLQKIPVLIVCV